MTTETERDPATPDAFDFAAELGQAITVALVDLDAAAGGTDTAA